MNQYIIDIMTAFKVIAFAFMSYYLFISFFGFGKRKREVGSETPATSFALVIAAHDEELVVGNIVESLKSQDYPKQLYDIFVIADNCTDRTADVARKAGALVYERFDKTRHGKGYALDWMFGKIFEMSRKYDAVGIFDADNIASPSFLKEMDKSLRGGHSVVQGYLDSKNPHDSWITESYSIAFWTTNRLFQLARYNLGLSAQLGGTGFCISTDILKEIGWGANCLTEDLEFTCKLILNGYKVGWSHDAVVYDEKPLGLVQSWNQRRRWVQGFADVASRFFFKLMKKAIKERDFIAFDTALYTIQPFVTVAFGISALLTLLQNIGSVDRSSLISNVMLSNLLLQAVGIFQFMYTPFVLVVEKKLSKWLFTIFGMYSIDTVLFNILFTHGINGNVWMISYWSFILVLVGIIGLIGKKRGLKIFVRYLLYGIYTLTWVPITIQGILEKNNKHWYHTKHIRQITISEIKGM